MSRQAGRIFGIRVETHIFFSRVYVVKAYGVDSGPFRINGLPAGQLTVGGCSAFSDFACPDFCYKIQQLRELNSEWTARPSDAGRKRVCGRSTL
jgi:hypothetical protein